MNRVELLIPAKNLETGKIAIDHGADALYMGASGFGARQAAGNSIADVEQMVRYAHLYGSKVYVTVNTLLFDDELEAVRTLIRQLYEAGVDALIIQDLGILKLDISPIRLHASTQCHNVSWERVRFMEQLGFRRAVLARELDLEAIRSIRSHTQIELEAFVHGALCVSYSGQCYMSQMVTGRSGNRGACAQLCRTRFSLKDKAGHTFLCDKHLLSLHDMNRSDYLKAMLNAGVTSFKVEGRLKDSSYVKNITAYYRQRLDEILQGREDYAKMGSGQTRFFFMPDPQKTFNRGFTTYFIEGKREPMASFDTPKAMGEFVGRLRQDARGRMLYQGPETIAKQDGLCFINAKGELEGFLVNSVEGECIVPNRPVTLSGPVDLYRNVDSTFEKLLAGKTAERKITVDMLLRETDKGFQLYIKDEDGCEATADLEVEKVPAQKPEMADQQIRTALSKLGNTPFRLRNLTMDATGYFVQTSHINRLRVEGVEKLIAARLDYFKAMDVEREIKPEICFEEADYKRNITNSLHEEVYADFGATRFEYGLDKTMDFKGKELMVCKYCLRYELGQCLKQHSDNKAIWYLQNEQHRFRLEFDCGRCVMKVIAE